VVTDPVISARRVADFWRDWLAVASAGEVAMYNLCDMVMRLSIVCLLHMSMLLANTIAQSAGYLWIFAQDRHDGQLG
jgi:hypothetical protein